MNAIFVSIPDAARAIGQGRTSVYELIRTNKIETVQAGRRRLVVVESLQAYAASLRSGSLGTEG